MLTCGLVRSNFAFATAGSSWTVISSFRRADGRSVCVAVLAGRTGDATPPVRPARQAVGLLACRLRRVDCSTPGSLRSLAAGATNDAHSPVAFAMISLATLVGTRSE